MQFSLVTYPVTAFKDCIDTLTPVRWSKGASILTEKGWGILLFPLSLTVLVGLLFEFGWLNQVWWWNDAIVNIPQCRIQRCFQCSRTSELGLWCMDQILLCDWIVCPIVLWKQVYWWLSGIHYVGKTSSIFFTYLVEVRWKTPSIERQSLEKLPCSW